MATPPEAAGFTADELKALAEEIYADDTLGHKARLLIWAVLTGIAQRMEREDR